MRVLFISHSYPLKSESLDSIGGMQIASLHLAEALKNKKNIELYTITHDVKDGRFKWFKVFIFLMKLFRLIPLRIRSCKPDVILYSSMVTAATLPLMFNKTETVKIAVNHGRDVTLPNPLYQWYIKYVFKYLDGVISVSEATRKASIKRGLNPNKGITIPNGISFTNPEDLPDKPKAKRIIEKNFGIDIQNKKVLLTVGRHIKRKGHLWFIKNVLQYLRSDIVYIIIGYGPESKNIEKTIIELRLESKVYLFGKQPKAILKKAYASADLFIMLNITVDGDMEGFGIVLLEANIAGTPAIGSDIEGIKDVIKQGVNGYKIAPQKPELFVEQIDMLLNSNKLEKLSISSKEFVEEKFNWNAVSNSYVAYFDQVVLNKDKKNKQINNLIEF